MKVVSYCGFLLSVLLSVKERHNGPPFLPQVCPVTAGPAPPHSARVECMASAETRSGRSYGLSFGGRKCPGFRCDRSGFFPAGFCREDSRNCCRVFPGSFWEGTPVKSLPCGPLPIQPGIPFSCRFSGCSCRNRLSLIKGGKGKSVCPPRSISDGENPQHESGKIRQWKQCQHPGRFPV